MNLVHGITLHILYSIWIIYTVEPLYNTIYYARYHIQRDIDKCTVLLRLCTHKRHSIPRPYGRAMGVFCEYFSKKQPCYEGFLLYIYGNKQLLVSDADSLTFIAQSSSECVRCIWNLFCYRVWFMNNLQHSCASRIRSLLATKKYIHKFTETEMSSLWWNSYNRLHRKATSRAASDENFIKMIIFPFQCSCKLNHTNIPCRHCPCVHNTLRSCVFK